MRGSLGGRARVGLCRVFAGTALVFWTSCIDTADDSKRPTRPLEFVYCIHPGALDAGSPGLVRAGVFVGPDGCWHLGGATLVRNGNRLVLSGDAVGETGPAVCPLRRVYDTLTLEIPPLEAGEYRLEAGDLVDTLVVGSPAPRPAGMFFAAHGFVWSYAPGCFLFHCPCPGGDEISGILDRPPMAQPLPVDVILLGSVAGRDSCGGMEFPVLRVRSSIFEPPRLSVVVVPSTSPITNPVSGDPPSSYRRVRFPPDARLPRHPPASGTWVLPGRRTGRSSPTT